MIGLWRQDGHGAFYRRAKSVRVLFDAQLGLAGARASIVADGTKHVLVMAGRGGARRGGRLARGRLCHSLPDEGHGGQTYGREADAAGWIRKHSASGCSQWRYADAGARAGALQFIKCTDAANQKRS